MHQWSWRRGSASSHRDKAARVPCRIVIHASLWPASSYGLVLVLVGGDHRLESAGNDFVSDTSK